ncbi:hypothetical protein SDC9_177291 [bioreactor metagenome]|uniref:Uncharacterized protein n=1 Tax=bioreactor metagenome TaxID=1076179 RepID=A0A645GSL3_9ZZZZ
MIVAVPGALMVTFIVVVVAQATEGVNVYVVVPAAAVLIVAGLHVPAMPLVDVPGNEAGEAPMQYGRNVVNVGVVPAEIVMLAVVEYEQELIVSV